MTMDLFHDLADPWTTVLSFTVIVAAVVYAWKNVGSPVWSFMRGRVHKQDEDEILSRLAKRFKDGDELEIHVAAVQKFIKQMPPNGGPTIWESLEANEKAHEQIFEEFAELQNKVDTFILQRRPNGRRSYDPHE